MLFTDIRGQAKAEVHMDIFNQSLQNDTLRPLSDRLRPQKWEDFHGLQNWPKSQRKLIESIRTKGFLPNLILWGPPGSGKTTFALLLKNLDENRNFIQVNAVDTGAKKLKEIGVEANYKKVAQSRQTVLFIDEIHRLNKAQQDILLPFTEAGDIILVGATTENPSYELNSALLSRCHVLRFEGLDVESSKEILEKAATTEGLKLRDLLSDEALDLVVRNSQGDIRSLLNIFESICRSWDKDNQLEPFTVEQVSDVLLSKQLSYDRQGSLHYDLISAFIKSVRGSDPDASLYYLARMVVGGEDPIFIARRLVILASEDIGNADPKGLEVAVAGLKAVEIIGLPEAGINLAQVTTYLACAPKSNRSYLGWKKALSCVENTGDIPVPLHLRSSRTEMSKHFGYGVGYEYSHDYPRGYSEQSYLPEQVHKTSFYEPIERGFERKILEYLKWLRG